MITENKPLLSYLLLTYNQEKYIREAVESAFAQTYSPLEIIISDDHSTDNTWEIIKELFNKYNGPHKIIINRNKNNLGIANHVNKVMSMAKGELFIMAAGDDISFPQRSEVLFEYWHKYKNKVFAFTSSMEGIDSLGKVCKKTDRSFSGKPEKLEIEEFYTNCHWCGAGSAYDRRLFDKFGPITYDFNEDRAYLSRTWLIGQTLAIKEVLIKYRFGGISTFKPDLLKNKQLDSKWILNSYKQLLKDIQTINITLQPHKINFILSQIKKYQILNHYYESLTLTRKLHYFILGIRNNYLSIRQALYLLPHKEQNKIFKTFNFIKKVIN